MTHALAAAHYADRAVSRAAAIVEHVPIARDTYRLRLEVPEIAGRIVPGQFLMLRLAGFDDPLLGRALALFDVAESCVDVVYMVVGKMTGRLASFLPGQRIDVWGPLGNGFPNPPVKHLILAAGGIGLTPFMAVAKQYLGLAGYGGRDRATRAERVTLCYGVRSAEYFAAVDEFKRLGVDVRLATDDGLAGLHGRVTDLLEPIFLSEAFAAERDATQVFCCGPEPMMEAVARVCREARVACQVSLETPMACGIGICFSCVTKVLQSDGSWDYKRTCVEGPIFDADRIVWH